MLGVFLDEESLNRADLDLGALKATLLAWRFYPNTREEEVAERIRDAHVVITNKVCLDESNLQGAAHLGLICVAATGANNVAFEAARRRGIVVCNVAGYAAHSVTQHVFLLILALLRRLPEYQQAVRDGLWRKSGHFCLLDYPIQELTGRILGIVGYGAIGRAVAGVARAFGMEVRVAARPGTEPQGERIALDELLSRADILTLHCPLAENTRGMIGSRELALMKPAALLINTARGGLVDEQALADALKGHRLGGAGVDVLTHEPPAAGNPLLESGIPHLIVTPHIAWASREARQRLADELGKNIAAWLAGQPRNRIV